MTFKKRPPYYHIERLPQRPTKIHNALCEHGAADWCPHGCFDRREDEELIEKILRDFISKQEQDILSTPLFGTASNIEQKPLTMDDIYDALFKVKGLLADIPPVRPFDKIQCSEGALVKLGEKVEIEHKQADNIMAFGVLVEICPTMPDNMIVLVQSPQHWGDLPKIYAIVDLDK